MIDGELLLIHGFWSTPRTWDPIVQRLRADEELATMRIDAFGYESPKVRLPLTPTRIPDYDDIAHSLGAYLALKDPSRPLAIVTHSQGGLILQRYLAWMIHEGKAGALTRIRLIVLLSCPNEGSEYLASIRWALGFGRHPQAGQLKTLVADATEARRTFLNSVVNATTPTDRQCPVPVHAYAGRTDNVVTRASAQSVYPNVGTLPGDHSGILRPDFPGSLTVATLKRHLGEAFGTTDRTTSPPPPHPVPASSATGAAEPPGPVAKYSVTLDGAQGVQVGDANVQHNTFPRR